MLLERWWFMTLTSLSGMEDLMKDKNILSTLVSSATLLLILSSFNMIWLYYTKLLPRFTLTPFLYYNLLTSLF